jgi:hypothetical protein
MPWLHGLLACLLFRVGLVLEWLYRGTLHESRAAKVRYRAQTTLGSRECNAQQAAQQVLQLLVACLQQQAKLLEQLQEVRSCCYTCQQRP